MTTQFTDEHVQQIEDALFTGNKILAIKLHREFTGEGLKNAKDFIEALERDLRRESPERFAHARARRGCFAIVALSSGIALLTLI